MNRKIIFLLILFIGVAIVNFFIFFYQHDRLYELDVDDVIQKIDNKESFVLCISQTFCTHCKNYKPKLGKISNDYEIDIYYIDIDKYEQEDKEKFLDYVSFDGSTPVTLFIENGEEITTSNRILGDVSSDKIIDKFKSMGVINEK